MKKLRKKSKAEFWQARVFQRVAISAAMHANAEERIAVREYCASLYEQFRPILELDPSAHVPRTLLPWLEKELPPLDDGGPTIVLGLFAGVAEKQVEKNRERHR